jgi:SAM-dependent methyltransferase
MSKLLASLPGRRLLDVGCSMGTLRSLLPQDFAYYGCDVSGQAQAVLGPERFQKIDFNQSTDLSTFADKKLDSFHIGGVLEYLHSPGALLRAVHGVGIPRASLVLSIINFEGARFDAAESHHPGWIFKPDLNEMRTLLAESGWKLKREIPFFHRKGYKEWGARTFARCLGMDHTWTRRQTVQFLFVAQKTA